MQVQATSSLSKGAGLKHVRGTCSEHKAEHEANRVLYRNTFGTQRAGGWLSNLFDLKLKNPANTNVVLWGAGARAKLLALWEVKPCCASLSH